MEQHSRLLSKPSWRKTLNSGLYYSQVRLYRSNIRDTIETALNHLLLASTAFGRTSTGIKFPATFDIKQSNEEGSAALSTWQIITIREKVHSTSDYNKYIHPWIVKSYFSTQISRRSTRWAIGVTERTGKRSLMTLQPNGTKTLEMQPSGTSWRERRSCAGKEEAVFLTIIEDPWRRRYLMRILTSSGTFSSLGNEVNPIGPLALVFFFLTNVRCKDYWTAPENCRKFFDEFAQETSMEQPQRPDNWYRVHPKDILQKQVQPLVFRLLIHKINI